MIGIQLGGAGGAVAVWKEHGPELIGRGEHLKELVALASAQGADCSAGIVAVPAWYNDVQRRQIFDEAKAAGISTLRLMNEPAAVMLAYAISQAALPKTGMVLHLSGDGAFDVTVIRMEGSTVEVVAANGLPQLKDGTPDQHFAAIEPVVKRALSDAGFRPDSLDAIILAGRAERLRSMSSRIESTWGHAPVEPPGPETAVACGAAVFGGFLNSRQ